MIYRVYVECKVDWRLKNRQRFVLQPAMGLPSGSGQVTKILGGNSHLYDYSRKFAINLAASYRIAGLFICCGVARKAYVPCVLRLLAFQYSPRNMFLDIARMGVNTAANLCTAGIHPRWALALSVRAINGIQQSRVVVWSIQQQTSGAGLPKLSSGEASKGVHWCYVDTKGMSDPAGCLTALTGMPPV